MSAQLRGTLFLLFFVPFTAVMALIAVVIPLIDRDGRVFHSHCRLWAGTALRLAAVSVETTCAEPLPDHVPLIFMSNHQGNFDIISLYRAIPRPFAWMAKEELFRIPLFGWALARAGYIPVDRHDGRKSLRSLLAAASVIRSGRSVVIFPEGTRSMDGNLLPFKRGGFILAAKAGVPIVPVGICGSLQVNPPRTTLLTPGTIRVRVGAPVPTEGRDPDELASTVESSIRSLLESAG